MWTGVTSGLAGIKFSTSPIRKGLMRVMEINRVIKHTIPTKSLIEKNGWNGILSILEFTPRGLLDPVWWRNKRCTIANALRIKGRRKCRAKNRVRVALSIEKPPQIHCTIVEPM